MKKVINILVNYIYLECIISYVKLPMSSIFLVETLNQGVYTGNDK